MCFQVVPEHNMHVAVYVTVTVKKAKVGDEGHALKEKWTNPYFLVKEKASHHLK